jgi:hypothetical protein
MAAKGNEENLQLIQSSEIGLGVVNRESKTR